MYKFLRSITMFFLFVIMFFFPSETFQGAANGLLLWYNSVFPTLFPYMIVSSLMIQTNTTSLIAKLFGPLFKRVFHISTHGVFAVIGGMLCGYPMGAKITAELVRSNKIVSEEGDYLLSFCNNTSPIFLLSFVLMNAVNCKAYIIPGMCIYLISPILCSCLYYSFHYKKIINSNMNKSFTTSESKSSFFINLDNAIMKSIESIVQVGGYIIVFSILIVLINTIIPVNNFCKSFLISLLEITNGIHILADICTSLEIQWILSLFLSTFGGFCSVAQTNCMLKGTNISIKNYIIEKLITASVTSLLAILYLIISRIF